MTKYVSICKRLITLNCAPASNRIYSSQIEWQEKINCTSIDLCNYEGKQRIIEILTEERIRVKRKGKDISMIESSLHWIYF